MKKTNHYLFIFIALAFIGCSREGRTDRTVLENKGSDTLVNVAQAWAEEYQAVNPSVAVAVTGGGSGTGIAALINGTVDIANSSREIKDSEMKQARAAGRNPKQHIVGYDALAVFVHKNNPLSQITIADLGRIYGEGGDLEKWSQLNVTVPGCSSDEIIRISRQNNSGTYEYFRETTLGSGDFKLGSRDMHGSKDVVDLVEKTACAIGYSGLAYANDHVKMPCILSEDGTCITPSMATAADRSYPISRPLFMYTDGEPSGATKTYMDWILSDEGQCIIQAKGYAAVRQVTCS